MIDKDRIILWIKVILAIAGILYLPFADWRVEGWVILLFLIANF